MGRARVRIPPGTPNTKEVNEMSESQMKNFNSVSDVIRYVNEHRLHCSCGEVITPDVHYWGPHTDGLVLSDRQLATRDGEVQGDGGSDLPMAYHVRCACGYGWSLDKYVRRIAQRRP